MTSTIFHSRFRGVTSIHVSVNPADSQLNNVFFQVILLGGVAIWAFSILTPERAERSPPDLSHEMAKSMSAESIDVNYLPAPSNLQTVIRTRDKSELHFIPPAEMRLSGTVLLGARIVTVPAFYISHTPVTNQQFVNFLNANLSRVKVVEGDVFLGEHLVLKVSEKIRGYKPIGMEDGRFVIKNPMHSSCAALLVTGYGAEAYAAYYQARLPRPEEWLYVKTTGGGGSSERKPLPLPVLNYEENKYGLRAIDQLAEWGQSGKGEFVIMGQTPSAMVEGRLISGENPEKYFTDTGFRVAVDAQQKEADFR